MSNPPTNKQMPRDAIVMMALLKEMGVTAHEPKIVNQMLEFVYRYITTVSEEARVFASFAKKKVIDIDDIRIAVNMVNQKTYSTAPSRELLMDMAKTRNSQPLPLLKSGSGLRLPPDRFCLTQPNYNLQFYKKSIASTSSTPVTSNVKLPGTGSVFKTPFARAPLPSSMSGSGSGSGSGSDTSSSSRSVGQINIPGGTATVRLLQPVLTGAPVSPVITGIKRKFSEDDGDMDMNNGNIQ